MTNSSVPSPLAGAGAEEEARKVKLAGRRRLCKLSDSAATASAAIEEQVDDDFDDGGSIRNILDDLATRFDSLSVQKPKPARSTAQELAPLPCALTTDPDDDGGNIASSPIQVSSSDEASTVISRGVKAKPAEPTSVVTTHHARQEVHDKRVTTNWGENRVSRASSFLDSDYGDGEEEEEEEETGTAYAAKHVRRKASTRRVPKASMFESYDDDGLAEKENNVIANNESEDVGWEKTEDFKMEPTGSAASSKPYKLPGRIFKMLYPHQREGLQWLWVLHCRGTGGILGDDMGLGKTMQVSAFLAGLFHSRLVKRVLVVAPKTLLAHWTKELSAVGLKEKIRDYSGPSTNIRNYELQYAFKEGGILLTTYDIVRNNYKLIRGSSYNNYDDDDEETMWNYVILDEGHLIKNNKTQRAQSLFEIPCIHRIIISGTPIQNNLKEMWALFNFCCPDVLGDKQQFKTRYEMAILRGNDKSATAREKHIGSNVATILKKICDHPLLLTKKAAEGVLEGMDEMLNDQDKGMVEKMAMNIADMGNDDDALDVGEEASCKLIFIMSLLRNLIEEGHHVLIFSQTRKMLNLIHETILMEGYKFLRIDGTTKISERERIVKDFQEGPGAPIFLLTTQVGGLGLTLTKADRVIVVDPAWNPSTDNQSVDRAYRIGQTKDVIVYRLMTSATIEEKIYKLQEIQELFSLPKQGFDVSLTHNQLQEEHGQQVIMDESLRKHIQFLEQQGIAGVSHHSLLFSKTAILPTLNENDTLDSKSRVMPMMYQHHYKGSSSDYVANGAALAFKPKDQQFTARKYSPVNRNAESPEEIKARINRLSQTLSNTALVSKLPDGGEKIRRQISELDEKLTVIESSAEREKGTTEVICLDDLSADVENIVLSV
ncbi:hypothetical protein PR202_ga18463 [Eleusine coracana subsp. coracana]|uniref:Protein CHROMATIN REMODELING 24 n=1 Tax=Eleusine coracana subsp. coracana TaxID=191504 RepID=A0AAV5CSW3_ELECO|nr:hypothetical protein PR202_ga18463 [Eleusine coracana subsp. coracana]